MSETGNEPAENADVPVRLSWLPGDDPLDQRLELVIWAQHSQASAAALMLQQMDTLRRGWQERHGLIDSETSHPMWRSMVWELSAALKMPTTTVENKLGVAKVLIDHFPATFTKMRSGVVSERHATTMLSYLGSLPDDEAAALEAELLPYAEKLTHGKFERKVRDTVAKHKPEEMEERHAKAMAERDVWVDDQRDGVGILSITMNIVDAHAAANLIAEQARALKGKGGDDETRTLGQIRADVARDMLLDAEGEISATEEAPEVRPVTRPVRGIVPTVAMTVPVLAALAFAKTGTSIQPAWLDGYGPIALSMAMKIAGAASGFTRILTDPHTGAPISVGRDRYRPPAEMRATVIREDGTCRGVGCNRPAAECDLDHTVPYNDGDARGETSLDNLTALCPNHHELKHNGEWSMTRGPGRRVYWVSPLGRVYDTEPEYNLPMEDSETTLQCMDPAWVFDMEYVDQTVEDPDWIPWLSAESQRKPARVSPAQTSAAADLDDAPRQVDGLGWWTNGGPTS